MGARAGQLTSNMQPCGSVQRAAPPCTFAGQQNAPTSPTHQPHPPTSPTNLTHQPHPPTHLTHQPHPPTPPLARGSAPCWSAAQPLTANQQSRPTAPLPSHPNAPPHPAGPGVGVGWVGGCGVGRVGAGGGGGRAGWWMDGDVGWGGRVGAGGGGGRAGWWMDGDVGWGGRVGGWGCPAASRPGSPHAGCLHATHTHPSDRAHALAAELLVQRGGQPWVLGSCQGAEQAGSLLGVLAGVRQAGGGGGRAQEHPMASP